MKNRDYFTSVVIMFLLLFNTGCMPTLYSIESVRSTNREGLLKLSRGMSKEQVLNSMLSGTYNTDGGIINNPYRNETLKGKDGDIYDIFFYYTDIKAQDGAITDDELTPIVFKDDKLIGWGWSFMQDTIGKYEIRIR